MAFSPVNIHESLRGWYDDGVHFVFRASLPAEDPSLKDKSPVQQEHANNLPEPDLPQWRELWLTRGASLLKHSRCIWTYPELGEDLIVAPNPSRRALLRKLIQQCGLPSGSITFWPYALKQNDIFVPAAEPFLHGVDKTGANTVVCFGPGLRDLLYPTATGDEILFDVKGIRFFILPYLDDPAFTSQDKGQALLDPIRAFLLSAG